MLGSPQSWMSTESAAWSMPFALPPPRAAGCAVDMLELNFAQGYLVASFVSPLTNQRGDEYGGSLD